MRHGYFGRKLSRTVDERRRLFMVLVRSLVQHGRIQTSLAKAKAVQPIIERLITKVKRGKTLDISQVRKVLPDKESVARLLAQTKTRFAKRTSGYTRVIRLGLRLGDAGETVLLEFVDQEPEKSVTKATKVTKEAPNVQEAAMVSEEKTGKTKKKSKSARTEKAKK